MDAAILALDTVMLRHEGAIKHGGHLVYFLPEDAKALFFFLCFFWCHIVSSL